SEVGSGKAEVGSLFVHFRLPPFAFRLPAGLDSLGVKTVLGNLCFHFRDLETGQLIPIADELLSTRLAFAKEQLRTLPISRHQEETLFQLLSGKRELFYPGSLITTIDKIAEELVTDVITVEAANEQLRKLHSHLFASDYKEELQWLAFVIDYIQYAEPLAKGVGERSEQVQAPSIPNSWEEWASFYVKKIAPLTLRYEQISTREHPILKRLKSKHSELLRSLDTSFADFVDNDAQWKALYENKQEYTILSIPKKLKLLLDEGRRLYVVFIDALRYDCWLHLRHLFEKEGFFVHTETPCFSSLPTETFYTKASLFAGTLREGIDPNIGEFSYLLSLSAGQIHYERHADNLTIAEVQRIFQADAQVKIFSYNLLDEGVKNDFLFNMPLEIVELLFQKLQRVVREAQEAGAYLVIISDHGFRELSVDEEMVESVAEDMATVRANRVITTHASKYKPKLHAIMKENKFYMVADYQARQKTQGSQAKRYSHGGVSLHEFIVPYAALSYSVHTFHPLQITLKESEFLEAQKNSLVLTIQNKNSGGIRLVELDALFDEMVLSDGAQRQERRKVYDMKLDTGANSISLVLELGIQPEFEEQNLDVLPKKLVVSGLCEWQGQEKKIEAQALEFVIRKNPQVTTSKMDDVLKELL
ncbi:TPA: PglZ domain-containing protein, partial [Candidatus Poribacteria bacterium]|nr:PglZ domain-containing protein [Candidatus Poribacteria bacterium]